MKKKAVKKVLHSNVENFVGNVDNFAENFLCQKIGFPLEMWKSLFSFHILHIV